MQKLKARLDAAKEIPDSEFLRAYGDLGSTLNSVKNNSRKKYFTQLVTEAKTLLDSVLPEVNPAHSTYALALMCLSNAKTT